jgi:hypothetical protein
VILRTLVSLVNLGIIAVALGVLLLYPQYAGIAFYALLGWMIGTLVIAYGPYGSRRVGSSGTTPPPFPSSPTGPAAPIPSGHDFGFCIYCAAPLPAGARLCPSCGHRVVAG